MKDFDIYKRLKRPLINKGPYKMNRYIRFNPRIPYEKEMFQELVLYSEKQGIPVNTVIKEMVFHVLEEERNSQN